MQVSVETLEGLKRRITVQLPAEQFDTAYQQRLQSAAKTARLDGFRKGKAPVKIIQQRYGAGIRQEVIEYLVQNSYDQAVRQEDLKPAGRPEIDSQPPKPGEDFVYTATFEVWPVFKLADLSEISFLKPIVEIADDDVESTLNKLREQQAEWLPEERAAETGDRIVVDFEGAINGEPFEGGSGSDTAIVLGEGSMIEGFESGLMGITPNNQRTIKITFPDDYPQESLRGQEAAFEVTCKQVAAKHVPELNEDFARLFGIEDGSLDAMRASIRKQLESEVSKGIRSFMREQILATLIKLHDIELPQSMIAAEVENLRHETARRLGIKETILRKWPIEEFEIRARRRVHSKLVVAQLIQEKNIEVDDQAVKAKIEEAIIDYENPDQMRQYLLSNNNALQHFRSIALEERVIDQIMQDSKPVDKTMSFEELMQAAQSDLRTE